ncbi:alpha/beta-hydrolase [Calocera viscosa TUFC12733]|uniref:Alpha/beta-hydrolase n=1 Tax=Calocera viscosa (strain TUFC12733) TaxID=1330018 RepID=A0A167MV30_CALVF|nr:alpha/beta-hydrolase [Calocera viscosa TUFC12733]
MSTPTPTYVFKKVGDLPIKADIYLPSSPTALPAPILVWWHGAGLIQSLRAWNVPHLIRAVDKYGLAVVGLDYRLAPQASLPEILEDMRDGVKWVREELPRLLGPRKVDPTRLATSGYSAGGYLCLLSGLPISGITPPPKVLLPIYPITNPLGPFFVTPQRPVKFSQDGYIFTDEDMKVHRDPNSTLLSESFEPFVPGKRFPNNSRMNFYTYVVQEGNLAQLLFAKAPGVNPSDYAVAKLVTKDMPPTYIVHGDADQHVGLEQTQMVVNAMIKVGATYKFEQPAGEPHGFDRREEVEMEKMYDFLFEHL